MTLSFLEYYVCFRGRNIKSTKAQRLVCSRLEIQTDSRQADTGIYFDHTSIVILSVGTVLVKDTTMN